MDFSPKPEQEKGSSSLSQPQVAVLAAIADRIFPRGETPGAVEIGALDYILIALDGDYAQFLPLYRAGLDAVSREARIRVQIDFVALDGAAQDAILTDFESGTVSGFDQAAEFFETLRYHVLEGVFCEPQYGGNKEMIGWRLVGFPGQQPGYPDPYINKRVDLPPLAVNYSKKENR